MPITFFKKKVRKKKKREVDGEALWDVACGKAQKNAMGTDGVMKFLHLSADDEACRVVVHDSTLSLRELQQYVCGRIDSVEIQVQCSSGRTVWLRVFVNDEGMLLFDQNAQLAMLFPHMPALHGPAIICQIDTDEEESSTGLDDDVVQELVARAHCAT